MNPLKAKIPASELMSEMTYNEIVTKVMKIRELRRAPVSKPRSAATKAKIEGKKETKKVINNLSAEDIQMLLSALQGGS